MHPYMSASSPIEVAPSGTKINAGGIPEPGTTANPVPVGSGIPSHVHMHPSVAAGPVGAVLPPGSSVDGACQAAERMPASYPVPSMATPLSESYTNAPPIPLAQPQHLQQQHPLQAPSNTSHPVALQQPEGAPALDTSGLEEDDDEVAAPHTSFGYGGVSATNPFFLGQDGASFPGSADAADDVDRRSVFVGNVDYGTTPPELQDHFKGCGVINRITIMVDRFTGHPKGYAYIEFQDESAIENAVTLSQSMFRDRPLKVTPKRKNIPGYSMMTRGRGGGPPSFPPRGGGFRRGGPPYNPAAAYNGMSMRGGRGGMRGGFPGYFPRYRGRNQRPRDPY